MDFVDVIERDAMGKSRPTDSKRYAPVPQSVDFLRVAFLEWLVARTGQTNKHNLWDEFIADWSQIPEYELPVNTHRPGTLHSYVKSFRSSANLHAVRTEIKEARAKLMAENGVHEGGLRANQSMLLYYLETEKSTPAHSAKSSKRARVTDAELAAEAEVADEDVTAVKVAVTMADDSAPVKRAKFETSAPSSRSSSLPPPLTVAANSFAVLDEEDDDFIVVQAPRPRFRPTRHR